MSTNKPAGIMIIDTNQNNEFAPPPGVKRWGGKNALQLLEEAAEDPLCSPAWKQAAREYHQEREGKPWLAAAVPAVRSTPQSTIEAIMWCVRERGISALKEPENVERLSRCDAAAKAQIDRRIENLAKLKGFPND